MFGKVGRTSNLSYVKETASLAKGNASRTIGTINQKASSDTCEFSTTTPKKPSLIQRAKNATIKLSTDDPIKTDAKKLLKKDTNVDGSYKSPSEIAEEVAKIIPEIMVEASKPNIICPMVSESSIFRHWYEDDMSTVLNDKFVKLIKDEGLSEKEAVDKIAEEHSELTYDQIYNFLINHCGYLWNNETI